MSHAVFETYLHETHLQEDKSRRSSEIQIRCSALSYPRGRGRRLPHGTARLPETEGTGQLPGRAGLGVLSESKCRGPRGCSAQDAPSPLAASSLHPGGWGCAKASLRLDAASGPRRARGTEQCPRLSTGAPDPGTHARAHTRTRTCTRMHTRTPVHTYVHTHRARLQGEPHTPSGKRQTQKYYKHLQPRRQNSLS